MALNFPSSPSDGDTFLGGNGINYIWSDADQSWQVYNDPASGIQVWSRDPSVPELFPVNSCHVSPRNLPKPPLNSPQNTLMSSSNIS